MLLENVHVVHIVNGNICAHVTMFSRGSIFSERASILGVVRGKLVDVLMHDC